MNNRVRIVIVGDSGVGKTCLTHLIAHNESLIRPGWTVGCNIQVKIHEFKEGTTRQCPYFVELFDVGGSLNHKNTRNVFYTGIHGIILVHDLTNGKSQENLLDWLCEILNKDGKDTHKCRINATTNSTTGTQRSAAPTLPTYSTDSHFRFDLEDFLGATQIPILVMGTKLDLTDEKRQPKTAVKKAGGIADRCGSEEIWLNCRDTRSLAAGTTDAVKLSRFFDCVIEKREKTTTTGTSAAAAAATSTGINSFYATTDRRRGVPTTTTEFTQEHNKMHSLVDGVISATSPLLDSRDIK